MKTRTDLIVRLEEGLQGIPILDVHTHLDSAHLSARGLADVLLYHMVVSDLYSAGCPSGHRVEEGTEADRIREALPFLKYIRNTSCCYGVRIILRDLYGFDEEITAANWEALDERIRAAAQDPQWPREVLRRANIRRAMTQHVWRRDGSADDCLQYSFEETAFCRVSRGGPLCQPSHEPRDTPLRELERVSGRSVVTMEDVHAALESYFAQIPYGQVLTFANHLSTDIAYRPVSAEEMAAALARRNEPDLPLAIRDVYSNYLLTALLTELERHSDEIVFQFSFGAEPLPYETGSKAKQDTLFELADLLTRFPKLRFNVFLASAHASQSLCTIARECPNLSFAAYWWHNFFPRAIRQVMHDRLDMVALNKQVGFFSDAYCVDWAYAKAVLVRQELARVLAEKVERGQYTEDLALDIARHLFWETPQTLLGMTPGTFAASGSGP